MEPLRPIVKGVLRDYPEIQLCIVFGSAATGKTSAKSDVDIAVAAHQADMMPYYDRILRERRARFLHG